MVSDGYEVISLRGFEGIHLDGPEGHQPVALLFRSDSSGSIRGNVCLMDANHVESNRWIRTEYPSMDTR